MKGKIIILEDACKGCGLCLEACPFELIKLGDTINSFGYKSIIHDDPDGKCTACKMCALICPDIAIEVIKFDKSDKEFAESAKKQE